MMITENSTVHEVRELENKVDEEENLLVGDDRLNAWGNNLVDERETALREMEVKFAAEREEKGKMMTIMELEKLKVEEREDTPDTPVPETQRDQSPGEQSGPGPAGEEKQGEVQVSKPTTHLFVGNIPHDVDTAQLTDFLEQFGTVVELTIKKCGKLPNYGFVVFDNPETVQHILSKKPIKFRDNCHLNVVERETKAKEKDALDTPVPDRDQRGRPPVHRGPRPVWEGKPGEAQVRKPTTHQLFVGNIHHDVDKAELTEFFEQYGKVLELTIKKGGKSPNYGFVVFDDSETVQQILGKRPIKFRGNRPLNVEEMKTKSPRKGIPRGLLTHSQKPIFDTRQGARPEEEKSVAPASPGPSVEGPGLPTDKSLNPVPTAAAFCQQTPCSEPGVPAEEDESAASAKAKEEFAMKIKCSSVPKLKLFEHFCKERPRESSASARITYDRGTLLDIELRQTHRSSDLLSTAASWPAEILREEYKPQHCSSREVKTATGENVPEHELG